MYNEIGSDLARRRVVGLMTTLYLLIIFEGAIRKWVLPGAEKVFFFSRDPVLFAALWIALRNRLVTATPLATWLVVLGSALALVGAGHVIVRGVPPIVIAFGLRNYSLHALTAVLMVATMTRDDVVRIIRLTLWIAIPMAGLALVQWRSPPTAWINKQLDGGAVFTVTENVVRVSGTFTFTAGFVHFVAAALACLAAAVLAGLASRWLLAAGAFSVAVCFATSGSRGVLFHAAITILMMLGAEMTRPLHRQRPMFYIGSVMLVGFLVLCVALIFPQAIENLIARQAAASDSEDTGARVIGIVTGGFAQLDSAGLVGYGVGSTTPFGVARTSGIDSPGFAEDEFGRVILECGVPLGFAYMFMRWGLAAWMALLAVQAMRVRADPVPLMLLSFTGVLLGVGQITAQGTINGYGWFFTGLTLVALKPYTQSNSPMKVA